MWFGGDGTWRRQDQGGLPVKEGWGGGPTSLPVRRDLQRADAPASHTLFLKGNSVVILSAQVKQEALLDSPATLQPTCPTAVWPSPHPVTL